MLLVEDDVV